MIRQNFLSPRTAPDVSSLEVNSSVSSVHILIVIGGNFEWALRRLQSKDRLGLGHVVVGGSG
jgi:hypothetical protein